MSYIDQVQAELQAIVVDMKTDGKASLPVYDPAAFDYRPVGDEMVLGCLDGVQRVEVRNTGRHFRGGGFWDAIARGFLGQRRAHLLMGSPVRVAEKEQRVTATGQLIVTNKAVAFEGDAKNERLTWQQVADVELLADGARITKRSGPPRTYVFTKLDSKFAAVLLAMSKAKPT
jgi:hypothetical protein